MPRLQGAPLQLLTLASCAAASNQEGLQAFAWAVYALAVPLLLLLQQVVQRCLLAVMLTVVPARQDRSDACAPRVAQQDPKHQGPSEASASAAAAAAASRHGVVDGAVEQPTRRHAVPAVVLQMHCSVPAAVQCGLSRDAPARRCRCVHKSAYQGVSMSRLAH